MSTSKTISWVCISRIKWCSRMGKANGKSPVRTGKLFVGLKERQFLVVGWRMRMRCSISLTKFKNKLGNVLFILNCCYYLYIFHVWLCWQDYLNCLNISSNHVIVNQFPISNWLLYSAIMSPPTLSRGNCIVLAIKPIIKIYIVGSSNGSTNPSKNDLKPT